MAAGRKAKFASLRVQNAIPYRKVAAVLLFHGESAIEPVEHLRGHSEIGSGQGLIADGVDQPETESRAAPTP